MKVIKTIPEYYKEINIPQPKYTFFHIGNYKDNLRTIKRRQMPVKHELYSISLMKNDLTNSEINIHHTRVKLRLFVISPFKEISWNITGQQIEGRYIIFDHSFLQSNPLWEHFLVRFPYFRLDKINTINVPDALLDTIDYYFENIYHEYYHNRPEQFDLIRSYVHTIFLLLNQHFINTEQLSVNQNLNNQLLAKFEALLVNTVASPELNVNLRQPSFYANAVNVHVNHLNAVIKLLTGKTTSALIHAHIIQQAGLLLRQTNLPVKELAARFRFPHTTHFILFFKKQTGLTPKQFKLNTNQQL